MTQPAPRIDISAVQSRLFATRQPVPPHVQEAMAKAWEDGIPSELRRKQDAPSPKPRTKAKPRLNGISDAKRAEIIRLRASGLPYHEIAKVTGVAKSEALKISRHILPEGANRRIDTLRARRQALTPEILRLRGEGLSYREIGKRFGIDGSTARRYATEDQDSAQI